MNFSERGDSKQGKGIRLISEVCVLFNLFFQMKPPEPQPSTQPPTANNELPNYENTGKNVCKTFLVYYLWILKYFDMFVQWECHVCSYINPAFSKLCCNLCGNAKECILRLDSDYKDGVLIIESDHVCFFAHQNLNI